MKLLRALLAQLGRRLTCFFKGHKPSVLRLVPVSFKGGPLDGPQKMYSRVCPRCGAVLW